MSEKYFDTSVWCSGASNGVSRCDFGNIRQSIPKCVMKHLVCPVDKHNWILTWECMQSKWEIGALFVCICFCILHNLVDGCVILCISNNPIKSIWCARFFLFKVPLQPHCTLEYVSIQRMKCHKICQSRWLLLNSAQYNETMKLLVAFAWCCWN